MHHKPDVIRHISWDAGKVTPDRFFSLLVALRSRPHTTTTTLAEVLGVSVRTVLRDLRWLQDAGFPIHVVRGRGGGVTLLPGGTLDTARLSPEERDHLALTGLDDRQREQLGTADGGRRARRKVAPSSPDGLLPLHTLVLTDNRPWFTAERQPAGVSPAALVGDLRRGVRLRLRYRGSEEPAPRWRVVDPYGLLAKAGRWYLVADESARPRLFLLDRVHAWRPLPTRRRLRAGETLATVADRLTTDWETARSLRVRGRLHVRQLDRARRMLGSRLTVDTAPGEGEAGAEWVPVTVACRVLEEVRLLLPFADDLTVTDPPEARARLRELAARIVEQYR